MLTTYLSLELSFGTGTQMVVDVVRQTRHLLYSHHAVRNTKTVEAVAQSRESGDRYRVCTYRVRERDERAGRHASGSGPRQTIRPRTRAEGRVAA